MLVPVLSTVLLAGITTAHHDILGKRVRACTADACLMTVTGTIGAPEPAQRTKDCESFLRRTVTGASEITVTSITTVYENPNTETFSATTITSFGTNTRATAQPATGSPSKPTASSHSFPSGSTATAKPTTATRSAATTRSLSSGAVTNISKRDLDAAAESGVPSYAASPCKDDPAHYSAACNCAGITGTTVTINPSSTRTVTAISTETIEPVYCIAFVVQATKGDLAGKYLQDSETYPGLVTFSGNDISEATVWTLLDDGKVALLYDKTKVWATYYGSPSALFIVSATNVPPYDNTTYKGPSDEYALFCKIGIQNHEYSGIPHCVGVSGPQYNPEIFQSCKNRPAVLVTETLSDGCVDSGLQVWPARECEGGHAGVVAHAKQ